MGGLGRQADEAFHPAQADGQGDQPQPAEEMLGQFRADQQQALFIIWFFLLFFLLLSGFFLPVENMPHWVQKVTLGNPVRWFMHVLREMFLKGSGFAELWREGLAMLAIVFGVFGLSLVKFSRQSS